MAHTPETVYQSNIKSLPLLNRGKVRDLYAVGDDQLLILTSDRLSAFDVVLEDPIPDKGRVLSEVSAFWFGMMQDLVPNHLTGRKLAEVLKDPNELAQAGGRSVIVRRYNPLPVECIVRGYLIGSGWKDYQKTGTVCGIPLPKGLRQAERLPRTIFTPSTKAEQGAHDENISFEQTEKLIGKELAAKVRDLSIAIYDRAAEYARKRGIIIADTKFEFGTDASGKLHLIDEVLTPDSSRFWPADSYEVGISPPSYDKQYVRDYLETLDWDKSPPAPRLPEEVIRNTSAKYREARDRLIK
jgi:phosphoribosylaminoimidazole-succinocarboxamide synthase